LGTVVDHNTQPRQSRLQVVAMFAECVIVVNKQHHPPQCATYMYSRAGSAPHCEGSVPVIEGFLSSHLTSQLIPGAINSVSWHAVMQVLACQTCFTLANQTIVGSNAFD
jgi:hypothetical protein